jgi:LysM repeat protein
LPRLVATLFALLLLVSCGRPAPEGEGELGAAPEPAAEGVADTSVTEDEAATPAEPAASESTENDQMTADGDQMTAMDESDGSSQTSAEIQSLPPVIITADSLSGVVDQSADRAGVRVTSSNPIVATPPVVETTTTTAVANQPGFHIVQPGDTLSVIAEMYGVPVQAIADANGLDDVNAIKPEQELIIPAG